ncbi:hypothetical protein V6N12_032985 [Hibiscus sabdariffa]|uniref:Uncharacterized protein n=1 Tax=Hibiscus sabdariffa TaxID=183260 RepID=A0ABR2AKP8_9ROSI
MVAGVHGVGDIPGEESVSVVPSLDIDVEDGRQYSEPTGEQVMAAGEDLESNIGVVADHEQIVAEKEGGCRVNHEEVGELRVPEECVRREEGGRL